GDAAAAKEEAAPAARKFLRDCIRVGSRSMSTHAELAPPWLSWLDVSRFPSTLRPAASGDWSGRGREPVERMPPGSGSAFVGPCYRPCYGPCYGVVASCAREVKISLAAANWAMTCAISSSERQPGWALACSVISSIHS